MRKNNFPEILRRPAERNIFLELLSDHQQENLIKAYPEYYAYILKVFGLYGKYGFPSIERLKGINSQLQAERGITIFHPFSLLSLDINISSLLLLRQNLVNQGILRENQTIIPPIFYLNELHSILAIQKPKSVPFIFTHKINKFLESEQGKTFTRNTLNKLNSANLVTAQGIPGVIHTLSESPVNETELALAQQVVIAGGNLPTTFFENDNEALCLENPSAKFILSLHNVTDILSIEFMQKATHI